MDILLKPLCEHHHRKTNWTAESFGHMSSMETRCVYLRLFFFYIGAHGYCRLLLGGILFHCETQEQLGGQENVMRSHIEIQMSSKWDEISFSVNYPFK